MSAAGPTWSTAAAEFLERPSSPATRRTYAGLLAQIGEHLLADTLPLAELTPAEIHAALTTAYGDAAPATWNLAANAARGLLTFAADREWTTDATAFRFGRLARRRRVPQRHDLALSPAFIDQLCTNRRHPLRERTLWRMLYETAARAEEVLRLDVDDLDQTNRTACTIRKGGDRDTLHYAAGTARLLPRLLDGRIAGPVFLSSRPPRAGALPALRDLDPSSGRGRLSYRQAAALFTEASNGATLHQLRHSALTHLAEAGASSALLMAKSRHAALSSLQRYVSPSQTAVARLTDQLDRTARRA